MLFSYGGGGRTDGSVFTKPAAPGRRAWERIRSELLLPMGLGFMAACEITGFLLDSILENP